MLGTVRAGRSFIDAFAGFLVLREARILDLAVRQRPSAAQRNRADAALARLAAGRAAGELGVGQALHPLEQTFAFFAVARRGGVFVDRHERILPDRPSSRAANQESRAGGAADPRTTSPTVSWVRASTSSPAMRARICRATRRPISAAGTRTVVSPGGVCAASFMSSKPVIS